MISYLQAHINLQVRHMSSVMVVTEIEIETEGSHEIFHLLHDNCLECSYRCLQGSEDPHDPYRSDRSRRRRCNGRARLRCSATLNNGKAETTDCDKCYRQTAYLCSRMLPAKTRRSTSLRKHPTATSFS